MTGNSKTLEIVIRSGCYLVAVFNLEKLNDNWWNQLQGVIYVALGGSNIFRYALICFSILVCVGFVTDKADAETFRWSFQADILSVGPHSVNEPFTLGLLGNIMEPLIRYDEEDTLEGALAESWELVELTRPHGWIHRLV